MPCRRHPSCPTRRPALLLTDTRLPPELTPTTWFTQWNLDLLWLLVCGFGIFFYLAGVRRLRRRGDRWPWYRTALWIAGMLLLFWVTNGPINVYEQYLFSVHMLGHMLLEHGDPGAAGARRADHPRAARDPQARRRIARGARVDPAGRALAGRRRC